MTPSFAKLWGNYPKASNPCDGPWANQCAIRMSIALNSEGKIKLTKMNYTEPTCKHGHARGAESLAGWLWRTQLGRPKIYKDGAVAKKRIRMKQGIIFFKNCFTRRGETARRGDHIDLWDKGKTKGFSDPRNLSDQVWFWAL